MYIGLLGTIAEVSATLAGFIGVVFVLGRRAEGRLTAEEASGLFHLLFTALGALFFSLGLAAALAATHEHPTTWRVGNGLLGFYHIVGVSRSTIAEVRGYQGLPGALSWFLQAGGYAFVIANLGVAAGFFLGAAPILFVACLCWFLLISLTYFVSLLSAGQRDA